MNTTSHTLENEGILISVSIGGFLSILLICTCCGMLFRCIPACCPDENIAQSPPQQSKVVMIETNPVNIAFVDEDPV